MTLRLTRRGLSQMRTGLAALAMSALLVTAAVTPVFATDGPTPPSVTVTQSSHARAASDVRVSVTDTNITVTWKRAAGFSGEYAVKLRKGGKTLIQRTTTKSTHTFTAPQVEVGNTYEITIEAVDDYTFLEIPESVVTAGPIVVPDPNAVTPPQGSGTEGEGAGGQDDGDQDDSGSSAPEGGSEGQAGGGEGNGAPGSSDSEGSAPGASAPGGPDSGAAPGGTEGGSSGSTDSGQTTDPAPGGNSEATPGGSQAGPHEGSQNGSGHNQGAPSAPQGVIAGILSDTSISVDFLRPASTGEAPINGYVVRLTPSTGGEPVEKILTSHDELANRYTIIERLTPGATYTVEVAARNSHGVGPFTSPKHKTVTLTPTPHVQLAIGAPVGVSLDNLDPAKPTPLTITGTGYNGVAAQTYGVDVVLSDPQNWRPGFFPLPDFKTRVHISPDMISQGAFSTTIEIDPLKSKLQLGAEYIVGTLAAGEAQLYERRLDQARNIDFQPLAPHSATLTKNGTRDVIVSWERPTQDTRITAYSVKLWKVTDGERSYVNQREVGPGLNAVPFVGLKDGDYVATVQSEIGGAEALSSQPRRSSTVETEQVSIRTAPAVDTDQVPAAPHGLDLRLALKNSTALEASWFEPSAKPGGKVINYEILLTGDDGSKVTLNADMNDPLPEFMTIRDLKPGVTYSFTVRAENAHGWSVWSTQSKSVTIPADQDAFAMTPPDEVNVLVDPDTAQASVGWITSGYEPATAQWLVRVECVAHCPEGFKSFIEDAPASADSVLLKNLKPGVYKASLKLVYGARQSKVVSSENFTIGAPMVVPNPQLTVTPTTDIDPAVTNTFSVTASGYVGSSASRGIYVVVADPSVWTPGKTPVFSQLSSFAAAIHVAPTDIRNGAFSATISVPAGAMDPAKTYVVGTMAAHELSISDRSMDAGQVIHFVNRPTPPAEQPQPTPPAEQPQSTPPAEQPQPTPPAEQPQPTPPAEQPQPTPPAEQPQSTPPAEQPQSTPPAEQPQSTPPAEQPQSTPPAEQPQSTPPAEHPQSGAQPGAKLLSATSDLPGGKAQTFVAGEAFTLALEFANVADGSRWTVTLHSDPITLGTVTVMGGKATLEIPASVSSTFPVGAHTLVLTPVNAADGQTISLPWTVVASDKQTPPGKDTPKNPDQTTDTPGKGSDQNGKGNNGKGQSGGTSSTTNGPSKSSLSGKSSGLASTGSTAGALAALSIVLVAAGATTVRMRRR